MSIILDILDKTGAVGYVLVALSILTVTILFAKIMQLWIVGGFSRAVLDRVCDHVEKNRYMEALEFSQSVRHPGARVAAVVLSGLLRLQDNTAIATLDREAERLATGMHQTLMSGLKLLGLIATLSPLLGLLGTVLGMIGSFQAMENAGAAVDASLLSGGIWEALLTTAMGLTVAIPATVSHSFLQSRIHRITDDVTDRVNWLFYHFGSLKPEARPQGAAIPVVAPIGAFSTT